MLVRTKPTYSTTHTTTSRSQPSATLNQATALEAEGVVVSRDALGELSVDLKTYGWFPRILPSAAARGEEVPDDSDSDEEEGEGHT